jgi:ABC-type transport system involved in multi-copper enzyme maturation permease subunit
MAILTIARLTLVEASRRRLLIALVALTLAVAALTGWVFNYAHTHAPNTRFLAQVIPLASQLLILVMFMFSWVLSLGAVFIAAPAIAGDVESGIALAMLPRPIRRSDLVLGKWLGLALLVTAYAAGSSAVELLVVKVAAAYQPPHPLEMTGFLIGEGLVMLTLAMLLSTRLAPMTSGIIAVVFFGLTWMAGIARDIGTALGYSGIIRMGDLSRLLLPTDGLWRGTIYNLEPPLIIAAAQALGQGVVAQPFLSTVAPPPPYLLWVVLWIVGVLGLGVLSFQRREL